MSKTGKPHRPFYQFGKYAVILGVAASFGTGFLWIILDTFFERAGEFGPEKHPAQSITLSIHGALAMGMMMLFGGTLVTHVRHYWRKRKNRVTGIVLVATWTILMISAYILYYVGNETLRITAHWIHVILGLGLPLGLALHIWLGNRLTQKIRVHSR